MLPIGAAGDINRQLLFSELQSVLAAYEAMLHASEPASPDFIRLQYHCNALQISDWLSNVRVEKGLMPHRYWQNHLLSETLFKDGQWQLRPLLLPLLSACVVSAAGVAVRQRVFAADQVLELPQIPAEQAQQYLAQLSALLQIGWCRPLPFQLKIGSLALQSKQDERLVSKLAQKFHGDDFNPGLLSENLYLARAYQDFTGFWSDEALTLCQQLLAPLLTWLAEAKNANANTNLGAADANA